MSRGETFPHIPAGQWLICELRDDEQRRNMYTYIPAVLLSFFMFSRPTPKGLKNICRPTRGRFLLAVSVINHGSPFPSSNTLICFLHINVTCKKLSFKDSRDSLSTVKDEGSLKYFIFINISDSKIPEIRYLQ
ncbi:hypothetical protein RRG08_058945 [Elysia crispata]|uniref:Uncharacterized protein n=1 Tax=Elysia crispata TaxID=231223 RepID=A0AAE0XSV3_9GAST|nr:hypothetical protein RRG08_058945 [Elysia crispata]